MVSNVLVIFLVGMGGEVVEGGFAFCMVGRYLECLFVKVEVMW